MSGDKANDNDRMFTLEWKEFQNTTIWHVYGPESPEQHECINVIEYSAYEQLQQENAELKAAREKDRKDAQELYLALVQAEKDLFKFNCDAPLYLTSDWMPYLRAREALEKWGGR